MELWTSAKADKIFSKFIRDRDKRCFFCPNLASQCSHFWGRGSSATRYDPENADGICGGCHMRHEGSKQGLYRDLKKEEFKHPDPKRSMEAGGALLQRLLADKKTTFDEFVFSL